MNNATKLLPLEARRKWASLASLLKNETKVMGVFELTHSRFVAFLSLLAHLSRVACSPTSTLSNIFFSHFGCNQVVIKYLQIAVTIHQDCKRRLLTVHIVQKYYTRYFSEQKSYIKVAKVGCQQNFTDC